VRETAANTTASLPRGNLILAGGTACGDILVCHEGISFWGGVDPETGQIIDAHHPDHGASLAWACGDDADIARIVQWQRCAVATGTERQCAGLRWSFARQKKH
jgi:hypothetical protein